MITEFSRAGCHPDENQDPYSRLYWILTYVRMTIEAQMTTHKRAIAGENKECGYDKRIYEEIYDQLDIWGHSVTAEILSAAAVPEGDGQVAWA